MDLLGSLCSLRQEERKTVGKFLTSRVSKPRRQTVLPQELEDRLVLSLKRMLLQNNILLELMCFAYDIAPRKVNIDQLIKFGDVGVLPEVYVLGLNKEANGRKSFDIVNFEGKAVGAKFLLFNRVWVYMLLVNDDSLVCRIVAEDELYIKPKNSGLFRRELNVVFLTDIAKETVMGLIEKYSGLFEGESYFYLLGGEFVTVKVYLENKLKESRRELKEAQKRSTSQTHESGPARISEDDGEDDEVYRIFGGKSNYEKQTDPNWLDKLYRPEDY